MTQVDGYEATMKLAEERPELLPLTRVVLEMGPEAFNEGLYELVARGILERSVLYEAPVP